MSPKRSRWVTTDSHPGHGGSAICCWRARSASPPRVSVAKPNGCWPPTPSPERCSQSCGSRCVTSPPRSRCRWRSRTNGSAAVWSGSSRPSIAFSWRTPRRAPAGRRGCQHECLGIDRVGHGGHRRRRSGQGRPGLSGRRRNRRGLPLVRAGTRARAARGDADRAYGSRGAPDAVCSRSDSPSVLDAEGCRNPEGRDDAQAANEADAPAHDDDAQCRGQLTEIPAGSLAPPRPAAPSSDRASSEVARPRSSPRPRQPMEAASSTHDP